MGGKPESIFLFIGDDVLQRSKAVQGVLRQRFGDEEIERIELDASQGHTGRAIEEMQSFSLLSSSKAVLLDHVETLKKADSEALAQVIGKPHGEILLLLFASAKNKVSKTLLNALNQNQIVELKKTTPAQLRDIINKRLAKQKVQLSPEAFAFLLEACGNDPETTLRETNKLLLWAEAGQTVTLDACRRLVQNQAEDRVWDLTDAVANRNSAQAVQTLKNLLDHGANPLQLTALLTTMLRRLYHVKALKNENASNNEIVERTGMKGWPLQNHQKQSARFSSQALRDGITLLKQADNDLKGGKPLSNDSFKIMVMERLLIDLCHLP